MAIISFWGNSEKETGQTIATIATATCMAVKHNIKVLAIGTGFKDDTFETSFWQKDDKRNLSRMIGLNNRQQSVESGVEGLAKVIRSNVARKGVVQNYVKVVFGENRLDILPAPSTQNVKEYISIAETYPSMLDFAKQDYNMVFIDVDKRMPGEIQKNILLKSDLIIVNIKQDQKSLDSFMELRKVNEMFKQNNILLLMGKYDRFSKFNTKNVTRFLKERKPVLAVPYSTIFSESTADGKVADYFLKYINLTDKTDQNAIFIDQTQITCETIISKLRELRIAI